MSGFSKFSAFTLRSGLTYSLTAPLRWDIGAKGSGWTLTVPEGRDFDISVPWYARWFLSPHDFTVLPAAALHDELLRLGHDAAFASSEFRRALRARGIGVVWAWVLFTVTLLWTAIRQSRLNKD